MARPIKETPMLSGKDAEQFLWHLEHPTPASQEEKDRARMIFETITSNPGTNW